jgi:hypothetical protein
MNAETTASHINAAMKIAITQPGPRRRYVMQMANQKEAKPDADFAFVNRATRQPARRCVGCPCRNYYDLGSVCCRQALLALTAAD